MQSTQGGDLLCEESSISIRNNLSSMIADDFKQMQIICENDNHCHCTDLLVRFFVLGILGTCTVYIDNDNDNFY